MKTSLPLPGSVHTEYFRCGKAGCRCNRGERHGPYYVREWRQQGRKRREYLRPEEVAETRARCAAWKQERAAHRATRAEAQALIRAFNQQAREVERLVRAWRGRKRSG